MSSASSSEPSPLFHHSHIDPLLQLLEPHLVHALPLYSTLQTPGVDVPVWATFPPLTAGEKSLSPAKPWFILADMGNQLRFFSSAETKEDRTDAERTKAEQQIIASFAWYVSTHANGREGAFSPLVLLFVRPLLTLRTTTEIRIGAIPDMWLSAIERGFSKPFYPSNIHYQALPPTTAAQHGALSYPAGVYAAPATEVHIEQVRSPSNRISPSSSPDLVSLLFRFFTLTHPLIDPLDLGRSPSSLLHTATPRPHHDPFPFRPSLRFCLFFAARACRTLHHPPRRLHWHGFRLPLSAPARARDVAAEGAHAGDGCVFTVAVVSEGRQ
jgi:hypothetical protein